MTRDHNANPNPRQGAPATNADDTAAPSQTDACAAMIRLGCVSFLNSLPLIASLDQQLDVDLTLDVPSRLAPLLASGQVHAALCPVIDYFRNDQPWELIPAGAIGCAGPTLTVRVFSQKPISEVTCVHVDTDSHTSVVLLRVLFHELFGRRVDVIRYSADSHQPIANDVQALLLIGDKVILASPPRKSFAHELDLGQAWHELTGLPFVFATWFGNPSVPGYDAHAIDRALTRQRQSNADRLDELVRMAAPKHGWPIDIATDYVTRILHYEMGPRQLQAIELFANKAHALGLISAVKPVRLSRPMADTAST